MIGLRDVAVMLVFISGVMASALKGDHVGKTDHVDPTGVHNKAPSIDKSLKMNWNELEKSHHKYKNKGMVDHNRVEPSGRHTGSLKPDTERSDTTTIPVTPRPRDEQELLGDWIRSVPKSIFNMKNRMRLASLFLGAQSKDDVIGALARAGGNHQLSHTRRRLGRRRRVRKIWPVPYHPNVRFFKGGRNFKNRG